MAPEASQVEYDERPRLLLLADSEAARERGRRSAERAGCRVLSAGGLKDGLGRIDQAVDGIFVEVDADGGEPLDLVLDRLEARARTEARLSVVSTPPSLIDAVSARALSPLVQHLCEAPESERIIAIVFAAAPARHMLRDVGKENGGLPRLDQLSQEVARIAQMLAAIAERQERVQRYGAGAQPGAAPIDAGLVRAMIRARRLRDHYLGADLFADPAWDIMLDLFAAQLEQQRVAVSSLCIAAAVPPTTALRWIKSLTDLGLLVRSADPQDGRRVYVELSPEASQALLAYLQAAQRVSPLLL